MSILPDQLQLESHKIKLIVSLLIIHVLYSIVMTVVQIFEFFPDDTNAKKGVNVAFPVISIVVIAIILLCFRGEKK